jgi:hypothetical protein
MAYQSTFSGLRQVPKTNNLIELANTLNNYATPALNAYASYKGEKITEETDREALIKARSTEAKSYADAVSLGELDGTQSPYWQSVYDNVKGKNHGIEFGITKQTQLNEWVQNNIAEDPLWEDKDGSQYFLWSQEYDTKYYNETIIKESSFFKKGLDGALTQTNANLGSSYSAYIKERQHTLLKKNLENVLMDSINVDLMVTDTAGEYMAITEFYRALNTEGSNAKLLAGLKGDEFNTIAIAAAQATIENFAIKGDPNANYEKAFAVLEAVKNYKRENGSNLFNADSSKKWAELEQELYAEQEQHEHFLEQKRKEILQNDFVQAQVKMLENGFTGGSLAKYDPLSAEKATYAVDAYGILITEWILKHNPDLDTREGSLQLNNYADELRDVVSDHYKIRHGEDVKIFDVQGYKNKAAKLRIINIPLQFTSIEEANAAVKQYNENRSGAIEQLMYDYGVEDPMTIYQQQLMMLIRSGYVVPAEQPDG